MTNIFYRVYLRIRLAIIDKLLLRLFFRKMFAGKSIAIVGSSPALLSQNLGSVIDANDIIVRINLMHLNGIDPRQGSRTDVRFIGCTLTDKHIKHLQNIKPDDVVITTSKNKGAAYLPKNTFYFHQNFPFLIFRIVNSLTAVPFEWKSIGKPPRSGLVFAALLLKYGAPRKVSLFGFSSQERDATKVISYDNGAVNDYDLGLLAYNHCSISDELRAINHLISHRLVNLL